MRRCGTILLLFVINFFALEGCSSFKPVVEDVRFFVLRPTPVQIYTGTKLRFGVAVVDIPDYLKRNEIAIRRGESEIRYSTKFQWAERLDKSIQRMLAAHLAPYATNVFLSAWRRTDVDAEIHISIRHFEMDEQGEVLLTAQWRITSPGSAITLHTSESKVSNHGPTFDRDADGAVRAMSEAMAELCEEISTAVQWAGAIR